MDSASDLVRSEDLVNFGFIPEFIGRIPVVTSLNELDHDSLIKILTEPKNALVKQYQKLVNLNDNVQLEFTDDALKAVATEALKRGTGARGLRSIIENSILDIIYDIPSQPGLSKCIVTDEVITSKKKPILSFENSKKKLAVTSKKALFEHFSTNFINISCINLINGYLQYIE